MLTSHLFTYGNKKKSFGLIKSMFWVLKNEEWYVFSGWFSWFLGRQLANKWLCTTQNWLFCVVLVVRWDMSSFSENTGDYLLESESWASNFCWIWLILQHPYSRLMFTCGLIRWNPRFITCHDVIDVFRSTAIVFLDHFFRPIDTSFFLTDWQIMWNPMRTNFIDSQMFMQYWMYADPTNAKIVSISR